MCIFSVTQAMGDHLPRAVHQISDFVNFSMLYYYFSLHIYVVLSYSDCIIAPFLYLWSVFTFVTRCNITEYSDMNKEKENKNADISARIAGILDYIGESKNAFALKLGYERAQTVYDIINGKSAPSYDFFKKFQFSEYSEIINTDWLITGRGSMLKGEGSAPMGGKEAQKEAVLPSKKNLIPFYEDVSTIGGLNDCLANTESNAPTEWIDAGDWFPEATAAIRHYGDSMIEYPSGSILALKRVCNPQLIMNGRNYVIETTEYRVTKQLQDDGDHFMAYSTNRDTYPDGRQIHAPFSVPKGEIRYIYLVLGCVTKEYSNGAIQIRR